MKKEGFLLGAVAGAGLVGGIIFDRVSLNDPGSEANVGSHYSLQEKDFQLKADLQYFSETIKDVIDTESDSFWTELSNFAKKSDRLSLREHFDVQKSGDTLVYKLTFPETTQNATRPSISIKDDGDSVRIATRIGRDGKIDNSREDKLTGLKIGKTRQELLNSIFAFVDTDKFSELLDSNIWEPTVFESGLGIKATVVKPQGTYSFSINQQGAVSICFEQNPQGQFAVA